MRDTEDETRPDRAEKVVSVSTTVAPLFATGTTKSAVFPKGFGSERGEGLLPYSRGTSLLNVHH